ncbi:nitrous oxide-stimulated promoter family protein [uncultured Selenomonas sp.]|uniref:nitrous oxide-stimulated promoter family protein n=1 Tax=uncultured Selenomonas sp. TaxID=159275 RepID=UPI002806068A|nr:nitrous oxide-stimulated promoter family protein [uncultured Selenomonas sp.]
MSFLSKFLPKKKPVEIKNNIPKEKNSIKKTFAVYCHAHHGTTGDKLCPKCTALLATVMTRMNRCRYGITKPICDRCEFTAQCFGERQAREFLTIMSSNRGRMYLKHPIMSIKHKFLSMGVDYARYEQQKKRDDKAKAKEKAAKGRSKEQKEKK